MSNKKREWSTLAIVTSKNSDFRPEIGDIADVLSFQREFLKREVGDQQRAAYLACWGETPGIWDTTYHEILLEIGMKGGKNFWAEGDAAYAIYFINCLRDPHAYFTKITKIPIPYTKEKTFDIINVSAADEDQARHAFFDSIKKILTLTKDPKTGDNWFERFAGLDLREEHGDFKKREVIFPVEEKGAGGIRLFSFNSGASAPEGIHMLRFYADELSRANTKARYQMANLLYELGLANTRASFPNRVAKVVGWSYPNDTEWDLTHERYDKSLELDSIYARRLKTWEFNPARTKEMFDDAYKADPIGAARIYECIKPISKDNFYQPYAFKIAEAVSKAIINKITYKPTNMKRETADGKEHTFTSIEVLGIVGDKRERCFAMDPSKTKDRFVIVGGYNETIDPRKMELLIDDNLEVITTNKKPICDVLIVIEPHNGYPIDYIKIGDLLTMLIKEFPNIQSINSEHFQTETLRQEILAKGISAATYFFSNIMQMRIYTKKRWAIWNSNFLMCDDISEGHRRKVGGQIISPSKLWVMEGERLLRTGNKIDHPPNFSKDVQDAVAILVSDLMALEAQQSSVDTGGGIEDLADEKLHELVERFMELKHELISADTPKELILPRIAEKLRIKEKDAERLEKFVFKFYGY
ncbi:MAG: hypothetical protein ACYC5G_04310 [Candidatus Doudnabacteria bacterium]